jgi:hypothetical protein
VLSMNSLLSQLNVSTLISFASQGGPSQKKLLNLKKANL